MAPVIPTGAIFSDQILLSSGRLADWVAGSRQWLSVGSDYPDHLAIVAEAHFIARGNARRLRARTRCQTQLVLLITGGKDDGSRAFRV